MKIIGIFILKCDDSQPIFLSTAYDLSFVRLYFEFFIKYKNNKLSWY